MVIFVRAHFEASISRTMPESHVGLIGARRASWASGLMGSMVNLADGQMSTSQFDPVLVKKYPVQRESGP